MRTGYVVAACAVVLFATCISGCGQTPNGNRQTSQNTPASAIQIVTEQETSPYRAAIMSGESNVQWIAPGAAGGSWPGRDVGSAAASLAIKSESASLAAVDYARLSLPDWVTETRSLSVKPADFSANGPWLDTFATSDAGRWAVYGWRGLEFPQKVGRPLVHRWVQVYALYSLDTGQVVRLLATVAGEALE